MENSSLNKLGSFWQHSQLPLPPTPPPSLLTSPLLDPQAQEPMLLTSGIIQEHVFSNIHGLDNLDHADLGASFLSLVSGPLLLVPCDEQHLLDPKPVSLVKLASSNHRSPSGFSEGSRASVLPGAVCPYNMDCPKLTSGGAFSHLTSSNADMNCSNSSPLFQPANLNLPISQAVACPNTHERDKAKRVSSLVGKNDASPVSSDRWKLQNYAEIMSLQQIPVKNSVSAYSYGYNPSNGSFLVSCSGISGNLHLSDTGLLGVVCACHGLYMSVSKFSEHSGSYDVNPGNAVHMDNGETLACWWKTFSKTGIRVLEGQKGWDWPEGVSVAFGLTNHPIASMTNPVLLNQVDPFKASVSLEQQKYCMINSKENQTGRNTDDKYLYHERSRTSQECSNSIFKDLMNSSRRSPQHAAGQHRYGLPNSFSVHAEKASPSSTDKLDTFRESASSLYAPRNIQDLKTPCGGLSVDRKTSSIVKGPGVRSNIELRLRQQPEHIQNFETKVQYAPRSNLNGIHAEPPKVFFPDKILQKSGNELQGSGLTQQYADITTNPTKRRGSTQLDHSCNVGGTYGAQPDYQNDPSNVSLEITRINSLLLSCFRNCRTNWQFGNVYANDNDSHASEKLHYESHAFNCQKICPSWSSVPPNMKEFGMNLSDAQINVNKGTEVGFSLNGLLGAAEPNVEFFKEFKEDLNSAHLVVSESLSSPAFHVKSFNLQQMPSMIADELYGKDILDNCSKFPPLSHIMHFNPDDIKHIQSSISYKGDIPMGFSSKDVVFVQRTPKSKEKSSGIQEGLKYEDVEMPAACNILELSNRDNVPVSVRSLQESETIMDLSLQSLLTISPSISKDHTNLVDSLRKQKLPEIGEKPILPCTICTMGHNSEQFGSMTGISLYNEDPNLLPVEQLFARQRGTDCKHVSQGLPYAYLPEKCSSAAQQNCFGGMNNVNGDNCCNLVKQEDRIGTLKSLLCSKLDENCIFLEETPKSFGKTVSSAAQNIRSAESLSLQRKHVPQKIVESCSLTWKEQQGGPAFARTVVPLKEQEISNNSSGCCAPEVTQSSIEVTKNDTSTAEDRNIRCANNLVLDGGPGKDRNWSSNDVLDNEFRVEFFESASSINLIKKEPSKIVPRKPPLSLIEEIRLQNSLQTRNSSYKMKRRSTIQKESDHSQKFEAGPKKRRKTIKWMKLDASVPLSGQSSTNNGSPKCTEEAGKNAQSFWEMQMPVRCDQGSPRNCADSIEKTAKLRNSPFSTAKQVPQRKNSQKVYHYGEQQSTKAHKSSVDDDNSKNSAIFGKKMFRLRDASTSCEVQYVCRNIPELPAKLTSLGGCSNSLGKLATRPRLFGKYGVITNGNLSKPAKIVPLRKILKTAAALSDKRNKNADDPDKLKSTLMELKNASFRQVKETALSKKLIKSHLNKGGTHNLQPFEPEYYDRDGNIKTTSSSSTNRSDDLSYNLQKCRNHAITERKPGTLLQTKFKEGRKRSLHELLIKATRCGQLMEKAVNGKTRANKVNYATRCSKTHQCENSDMFSCVWGDSDKDEYNRLLQCSRFLLKQMNTDSKRGEKFLTCARTEVYNGRKREGFLHNHSQNTDGNSGCLVPREQLNAWLYIHRQKPQTRGRPKLSCSNVESDRLKAYARYRQSKSWEQLVVYKSGIHALGLYTSQFISRGAMVVEYVGEIVGLRVADRREKEYHSGKKIQHKSACYFFRIDKEHIIDATREGGIARFVNHSCQPNCVAEVISVRSEKKVVFFVERDIYPGEEITYDYHFNHEDEGERIPCYCNSKNCRQ